MSGARPQFSIDDAFELSLEDTGPVPEASGVARFGPLHFDRRARFEVTDEEKQSRLRYQNLENDADGAQVSPESVVDVAVGTRDSAQTSIRSSQWSFSTASGGTQRSYRACCSWTQHPLIQKNHRVVLASFLLLVLGLVLVLVGVGLQVAPSPGVSSAIFFVPGFLLLVPGGAAMRSTT
ncbi:transmembrane protein 134 isoform X3 [Erinaceus europaeus]|uniref:Transmembrane protein 134 isoform X3 n=1 Tax=Erinaceus europaeus TaxID=9365 RepID=A0A1S3W5W4_ERIEU|nr:transmembrane protein 134 isoform X3 [Erinaceus europaeus]